MLEMERIKDARNIVPRQKIPKKKKRPEWKRQREFQWHQWLQHHSLVSAPKSPTHSDNLQMNHSHLSPSFFPSTHIRIRNTQYNLEIGRAHV